MVLVIKICFLLMVFVVIFVVSKKLLKVSIKLLVSYDSVVGELFSDCCIVGVVMMLLVKFNGSSKVVIKIENVVRVLVYWEGVLVGSNIGWFLLVGKE